jgi:hypothetical protein
MFERILKSEANVKWGCGWLGMRLIEYDRFVAVAENAMLQMPH